VPGALVRRFIEAIEHKNLSGALELLSPDCEYDNVPMGSVQGPDAVAATLAPFLAGFDTVEWVVHHQVESGDVHDGVVMNERLDRFGRDDQWLELPVAGLFVVRGGRITLWRDYFDRDMLLRQMAAMG
jgi:limonene-1,2-epoxide hydrolase